MAVVDDNVWIALFVINRKQASEILLDDVTIENGTTQISMSKKTKAQEWMSYAFGKEDSAYAGGDVRESISNTSYDDVLEDCRLPHERRLIFPSHEISLMDKLDWQDQDLVIVSLDGEHGGFWREPRKGRTFTTTSKVEKIPA